MVFKLEIIQIFHFITVVVLLIGLMDSVVADSHHS